MSWLLDANALIALGWPAHEHHRQVAKWFDAHASEGWATCTFTQSAFVRIVTQPTFAGRPVRVQDAAELLMRNTAHPKHRLLALDFGIEQVLGCCTGGLLGHRQVTDAWLLALAQRHKARLVTFDAGIGTLLASDAERKRLLHVLH